MVFEINLLPEKYRKRGFKIQVDARLLGILAGVVVIALLGYVTVQQGKTLNKMRGQKNEFQAQKDLLEPQAVRVDRMQTEIRDLQEKINTLQGLGGRNTIQLRILEIIASQLPDTVSLLDLNQTASQQQGTGPQLPADRVLNLRGHALRKEAITELISRLQGQDLIQRVQTNYMRPATIAGQSVFEFSLTAVLNAAG